jgi:hypothetical protein
MERPEERRKVEETSANDRLLRLDLRATKNRSLELSAGRQAGGFPKWNPLIQHAQQV